MHGKDYARVVGHPFGAHGDLPRRAFQLVRALFGIVLASTVLVGCTDRQFANWSAYGEPHVIELYSGGKIVATYQSTGKVECSEGGICSFMDATTKKLIRTSGDVVIRVK